MKLRNKKTGDIIECPMIRMSIDVCDLMHYEFPSSIAKLNEEWEDYKPKEPLIKDEKVRKAVKAWAEVNSIEEVIYAERAGRNSFTLINMSRDDHRIEFVGYVQTLEDAETYSIAELCGEEEAPEPLEPSFIDISERIREIASEKHYKGENDMHLIEEDE